MSDPAISDVSALMAILIDGYQNDKTGFTHAYLMGKLEMGETEYFTMVDSLTTVEPFREAGIIYRGRK